MGQDRVGFGEALAFICAHPVGYLATVAGGRPHVRPMTAWQADGTGIYFYTSTAKALFGQLQADPQVEVVFADPVAGKGAPGSMIRLAGRVEFTSDPGIRQRLWAFDPGLAKIGTPQQAATIAVFRIARGRFGSWTPENQVRPAPWSDFP